MGQACTRSADPDTPEEGGKSEEVETKTVTSAKLHEVASTSDVSPPKADSLLALEATDSGSMPALPAAQTVQLNPEQEKAILDRIKIKRTIWITGEKTVGFSEHYSQGKQLGNAGAYGTVYLAKNKQSGEGFAVKVLEKSKFHHITHEDLRLRYLRSLIGEIEVMLQLRGHPNIIKLVGIYEDKPQLRLVMEKCDGGELFRLCAKPLPEGRAQDITRQIIDGLKYMQDEYGVVHCDLKPGNILFADKEQTIVKIIDFGMAKSLQPTEYMSDLVGTPYYTAPEIIPVSKSPPQYKHPADMWAVGCIVFVMLYSYPCFYVDQRKYSGRSEQRAIYRRIVKHGFLPEVKKGYGPWFPKDMGLRSERSRDFIAKLLISKASERMTAGQALEHAWLTVGRDEASDEKSDAGDDDDDAAVAEDATVAKPDFVRGQQFRESVVAVFTQYYAKMKPEHFTQFDNSLSEMDTEGTGAVTYGQFVEAFLKLDIGIDAADVRSQFGEALTDADAAADVVQFSEFVANLVKSYSRFCSELLYKELNIMDATDSGWLPVAILKQTTKRFDLLYTAERTQKAVDLVVDDKGLVDYMAFVQKLYPELGANEMAPKDSPALKAVPSVQRYELKVREVRARKSSRKSKLKMTIAEDAEAD